MSFVEDIETEKDYFRESMEPLHGSNGGIRDTLRFGEDRMCTISKQSNETSVGSIRDKTRTSNDETFIKEKNDGKVDRRRKQKALEYQWKRVHCGNAGDSATKFWDYLKKSSFCIEFYENFDKNRLNDIKYIDYMTYWGVRKECLDKMGFLAD